MSESMVFQQIYPPLIQRGGGGGSGLPPDWKRETVDDLELVSRPAADVRVDGIPINLRYPARWWWRKRSSS